MASSVSVTAIISAFNEADIIGQVVEDLLKQDVSVYLLDDGSTDDTVAVVTPFVGRGVIAIERFSRPGPGGSPHAFALERILRRKSQLARELDADWFINHDADEFRESPWSGLTLRAAINRVHDAGYNAIDFTCLEFLGNVEMPSPPQDVRAAFPRYTAAEPYNRVQVRCWRRTDNPVDLASSGGHDVSFPNRRVFPIRFILRHYPIRGRAHFERKVLRERNYDEDERARGWHVHYSVTNPDRPAATPMGSLYQPDEVRLDLMLRHRTVEELEDTVTSLTDRVIALDTSLQSRLRDLMDCRADAQALRHEHRRLQAVIAERGQLIDQLYQSRSWRWSAPARALGRLFGFR